MTKQTDKPAPAQSTPKTKSDGALPDAALEQVAGGKPQSDVSAKWRSTLDGIAQNFK